MNERQLIEQAIAGYQARIGLLKEQGVAKGCVVTGVNGKGKPQSHFVPVGGGRRVYLRKALVKEKRAECQRWRRVEEYELRIELLQAAIAL